MKEIYNYYKVPFYVFETHKLAATEFLHFKITYFGKFDNGEKCSFKKQIGGMGGYLKHFF